MEVVALVWSDGHEGGRHSEAMQVARYGTIHVGNLLEVEVIGGREIEVPIPRGTDTAREGEILGPFAVVFHLIVVKGTVGIVQGIVEGERPGK